MSESDLTGNEALRSSIRIPAAPPEEHRKIHDNSIGDESLTEMNKIFEKVTDEIPSNVFSTVCGEKEDATILSFTFPMENGFARSLGSDNYEEVERCATGETACRAATTVESSLDEESGVEEKCDVEDRGYNVVRSINVSHSSIAHFVSTNLPVTNENSGMVTRMSPSQISSPYESPTKECPIECNWLKVEKEEADDDEINQREGNRGTKSKEPKPSLIPQHLLNLANHHRTGVVALRIPLSNSTINEVYSKVVTVLGVSWCLYYKDLGDSFGLFLKCLEEDDTEFTCEASISYKMHHPLDGELDEEKSAQHTFDTRQNDWGYKCWRKSKAVPSYVRSDNTVLFSVQFFIKYPQGVRFLNEETRIPVGLINQGATCYMNAALQILFFTKCLSKAILQLDFKEEDSGVVKSLQKLFYKMTTSTEALSTKDLTNAFGWNNTDNTLTQQDVQEMMNLLLDKIEMTFKGTQFECMVNDLFMTKTRMFIRCLDVGVESGRDETCMDIKLPVKRLNGSDEAFDIVSALREVTQTEVMDGDNKYDAEGCGLQRAEKGTKFLSLPKILHIQLLRFQLDWYSGEHVKVNNRVEFSDILDLQEFVETGENGTQHEYEYALHGVVCHTGTATRGHYVTFVCLYPGADKQKWFRLDDSVVTEVPKESVICEEHFGIGSADSFNAYMLTYIRTDLLREVLNEFPLSIVSERLRKEVEMEANMKKWETIAAQLGIFRIRFVKEPDEMSERIWDHYDYVNWTNDPYRLKMDGNDSAIKLFHEAQEWSGLSHVRLFLLERRRHNKKKGEIWRVNKELECGLVEAQLRTVQSIVGGYGPAEYLIFIMGSKPLSLNQTVTEENGSKITIFIKWYDGIAHSTRYVSSMEVPSVVSVCDLCESVSMAVHLSPFTHIKLWKEIWFDELEEMKDVKWIEVEMGDVLVFEAMHLIRTERTVQSIIDDARQVHVFFKHCINRPCFGLINEEDNQIVPSLTVSMMCTYRSILEQLSPLVNHPTEKIMLWVNGKTVDSGHLDDTIRNALTHSPINDPREYSKACIEFGRLSVTLTQSLLHIGIATAVRTVGYGHVLNTEYVTRNECLVSQLKDQLAEKYHETGDIDRLRFVWRFRAGSGYFVFREIRSDENMLEMMEKNNDATDGSLMMCVDEMMDWEMDEMAQDDIIVPLVIIKSRLVSLFTNEEPTLFIKIRESYDMATIQMIIEDKCRFSVNWENVQLLAFMGSKETMINMRSRLGLNALYEELREERGLSASRPTSGFIGMLMRETTAVEEKVNLSQSIVIQD